MSFNRLAEAELIAAARYLDAESNLGSAFPDDYVEWEKQVRAFSESCPEIVPSIRCGFIARFKYHVTSMLRTDSLRILYVRSTRQAPLRRWPRV